MSLNNIQLKSSLLAGLYKNSLVQTERIVTAEMKPVKCLGNNHKNILVIVSNPSVPFLPDEEFNFLTSILAACKLSIADIGIINNKNTELADLQNLINLESKNVLLFGVEPLTIGLPINFPAFQLQSFNSRTYLYAPQLSQIENDKALKGRLWSALKTMFGI
jgi:hypothetical protein